MSWKLGEKVLSNCARKLRPYLMEMVQSTGITLDEYSPLVASICKSESNNLEHHNVNESGEILVQYSFFFLIFLMQISYLSKMRNNCHTSLRLDCFMLFYSFS